MLQSERESQSHSWFSITNRFPRFFSKSLNASTPHVTDNYRPDIDGLRAFAVVSVVLYHAFPKVITGGYVGVDVFFVISGFLISKILFAEITEHRFTFRAFYGRRIRRIFPALAVCLVAVLAFGFISLMPSELAQLGKHVFFGAGFLSNIVLWSESGYFDHAASLKPLLHLWSLGIEEQFYILWPALLWMAFRMKARMGRLLAVLFLASFAINIALSINNIVDDFYLPVSRFWELLAGAGLAWWRPIVLTSSARSWISFGGLTALLISVALFTPELRFPGWLALLPVAGAVAVILAGREAMVNRIVLSNRAVIFVGLISYPLYLWHWPLISYAYIIRLGKPPTPLMALGLVAASLLLAWATYRFVENPVRFGAHRHRRTQIVAACVAALGACGLAVWTKSGFPERFPLLPGIDIRKIGDAKLDADFKATNGMEVLDHGWTLVTQLGHGERKVALSGDSMLFHYGPRVQQLADDGQLAANTYFVTGPRCPPVPKVIQRDKFARCIDLPGILVDLVRRQNVQSVVLGAAWAGYSDEGMLIERDGGRLPLNIKEGMDAFYANLEDYVRLLQRHGAKVYLVLGVPQHQRFNPGEMVTRGVAGVRIAPDVENAVPIAGLRSAHGAADAKLRTVSEHTGAVLLDPLPDICGGGEGCSPFFGVGEPKFSDRVHLRPIFVREHLRFLDPLLK
ncbi:peptidoglycan/LPS O-acetylase OafA/YrhL [Bradyrhizobium sp. AZCC 1610]|uniref:acyltransferase family protein n=1 Tax=Bradyrhizobium sp. AZCC 1610 TaxID=3117020 RepID=UPI002FEEE16B